MDSNEAFVGAVRASKRVRGISAPPEQPLEHTRRKSKSKNQGVLEIPAFRAPGNGISTPSSPRPSQGAAELRVDEPETRNGAGRDPGQTSQPEPNGSSQDIPSGEEKEMYERKDSVLTDNPNTK